MNVVALTLFALLMGWLVWTVATGALREKNRKLAYLRLATCLFLVIGTLRVLLA